MIDPKMLMTDDGVDATTLIGEKVWTPDGFGGITSFVVDGIDLVRNEADDGVEARIYGEDKNPWLLCGEVRAVAGSWAIDAYTKRMNKINIDAAKDGVVINWTIKETDK